MCGVRISGKEGRMKATVEFGSTGRLALKSSKDSNVLSDATASDGEKDDRKNEEAGTAEGDSAESWPLVISTPDAKVAGAVGCAGGR